MPVIFGIGKGSTPSWINIRVEFDENRNNEKWNMKIQKHGKLSFPKPEKQGLDYIQMCLQYTFNKFLLPLVLECLYIRIYKISCTLKI